MFKSLWLKFFLLLTAVVAVCLSATFLLRELMLKDFRQYLEGEMEDRAYYITASLESSYLRNAGWNRQDVVQSAVWAFMLGLDIKLFDEDGTMVMDTEQALGHLSPLVKKRVMGFSERRIRGTRYLPYALFLGGEEIGRLDVRFMSPRRKALFLERSLYFFIGSVMMLGGVALLLSFIFSRKLIKPIKALTSASESLSDGNLKSRVAITRLDEIGKLSDTFNKMAEKIMLQEALRKKLTSNVAHELRTPLSAIRAELEGMLDGFIPVEKESLRSLYDETSRLRNILDGMEELSRAEASGLNLNRKDFALKPFLKNIAERFRKISMDRGVKLEFSSDKNLQINADPDRLSQILINLLSNALKATKKGDKIILRGYQKDMSVYIEVEDTGCGIKREELPLIFERFYKGEGGGLGIGLTIVKELADVHNAKLNVLSEPGKGSVFTLVFSGGQTPS